VEKGLSLLNSNGRLGFILPHKFFNAQYGQPLRGLIAQGKHLSKVVHFGDQQVFDNATTYTCLMFLNKQGQEIITFEKVSEIANWKNGNSGSVINLDYMNLGNLECNFQNREQ
jgi:type I restriction-modification system DNA methylase subunit